MSGSWLYQLQPASWRGLPFAVDSSTVRRGRRTATHEYPFRDQVWVEDLGRGVRGVSFTGFVVGDDCYAQARALLDRSEEPGSGELVHPSLGTLTVALVGPLETTERKDLGRAVEIRFEFIETGEAIYPSADVDTSDAVFDCAGDADIASSGDFLSSIGDAVQQGVQVVAAGLATAQGFVRQVQSLARDASVVVGAVSGLPGNYGRFSSGARGTLLSGAALGGSSGLLGGLNQAQGVLSQAQGAIGAVVVAQAAVDHAAGTVLDLAEAL